MTTVAADGSPASRGCSTCGTTFPTETTVTTGTPGRPVLSPTSPARCGTFPVPSTTLLDSGRPLWLLPSVAETPGVIRPRVQSVTVR